MRHLKMNFWNDIQSNCPSSKKIPRKFRSSCTKKEESYLGQIIFQLNLLANSIALITAKSLASRALRFPKGAKKHPLIKPPEVQKTAPQLAGLGQTIVAPFVLNFICLDLWANQFIEIILGTLAGEPLTPKFLKTNKLEIELNIKISRFFNHLPNKRKRPQKSNRSTFKIN